MKLPFQSYLRKHVSVVIELSHVCEAENFTSSFGKMKFLFTYLAAMFHALLSRSAIPYTRLCVAPVCNSLCICENDALMKAASAHGIFVKPASNCARKDV